MEQPLSTKMLTSLTILTMATAAVALPLLEEQAGALLAWKATLSNQTQHALQSWGNTSAPCRWRGIRCGIIHDVHRPVITGVSLPGMRLRGTLESLDFSSLRTLMILNLSDNGLVGSVPSSIGLLKELCFLLLHGNQIRGSIPPALANLTNLHSLMLHENQISGEIPKEIGNVGSIRGSVEHCSKLRLLKLSQNHLSGIIPIELGMLVYIQDVLDLSDNSFDDIIPSQLGGLIMLEALNISHNMLDGSIPPSFQRMLSLLSMDVSYNKLEGPVPQSKFFEEAPIEWFMHNNQLCGVVKGLPSCELTRSHGQKKKSKVVVLAIIPAVVSFVLIMAVVTILQCKKKKSTTGSENEPQQTSLFAIWNFHGQDVYKKIVDATENFNDTHCIGIGDLRLVVLFSSRLKERASFRLDPDSVSAALSACLGGIAKDFQVVFLRDRTFRFSVCSRKVGFFVNQLRSFSCKDFMVYFLLWGNGGPNAFREFRLWQQEETQSWTTVKSKPSSFADAVRGPLTGANLTAIGSTVANLPGSHLLPRFSFIVGLNSELRLLLEDLVNAEYSTDDILLHFRAHCAKISLESPLDHLSSADLAAISDLASLKLFTVDLSNFFKLLLKRYPLKDGPKITVKEVFSRLNNDLRNLGGNSIDSAGLRKKVSSPVRPGRPMSGPRCSRCQSPNHARINCLNNIKCFFCESFGHIKANCFSYLFGKDPAVKQRKVWVPKKQTPPFLEKEISPSVDLRGHRFGLAGSFDRRLFDPTAQDQPPPPDRSFQLINLDLSLYSPRQTTVAASPPLSYQPLQSPKYCSTAPSTSPAELSVAMANFPVDPTPYIPGQYELIQVAHRPQQCRYHVTDGIRVKHEDVAIATVTPPPGDAVPFGLVRNMLRNLIEIEYGFTLEMIQRCPIGTAFVRVSSFADRDWLVNQSPHHFAGRTISFVNHNEGINHRAFTYNQECWLLLLAYPLDLWNSEHIKRAVKDFGVFVAWDEEASCYGAIVVKVRVADLQHIPHSCVVTDGNAFQGESWTVPIFILSQKLLGNLPADEDDPPADGSTPHPMPMQPFQPDFVPGVHDAVHVPAPVWPAWEPHHQQFDAGLEDNLQNNVNVQQNNMQHNVNIQQNIDFLFPDNAALNINVPPADIDLNVVPGEAFIELNDLVNPVLQNQEDIQHMDIDHAAPGDSSITLTISTDPSVSEGSGGFVNGAFVGPPNNLQIGLAFVPEVQADPGFLSREGAIAWEKFFKPSSVTDCHGTISVPTDWVEFLMCLCTSLYFKIHCNKKKRGPLVISEVRRSDRIQAQSKGYRRKTCFDKNCLACAPPIPGLKSKVVKNLYTKFGLTDKDKDVVAEEDGGVSFPVEEDSASDDSDE
ncbi:hypothetical protein ACQ4PT_060708 [Festuca glaucescens]